MAKAAAVVAKYKSANLNLTRIVSNLAFVAACAVRGTRLGSETQPGFFEVADWHSMGSCAMVSHCATIDAVLVSNEIGRARFGLVFGMCETIWFYLRICHVKVEVTSNQDLGHMLLEGTMKAP